MSEQKPTQFLFLDFGGCIDSPGIHTRKLFSQAFRAHTCLTNEQTARFQEAYGNADRRMMCTGEAKTLRLKEFNRWNAKLIATELASSLKEAEHAADNVTEKMRGYLMESAGVIRALRGNVGLGVISNFTGNLNLILEEHGILCEFDSVTESFYAGFSKPAKEIFQQALQKHSFAVENCMYVGDNPRNDIQPAKALGMKATLIHERLHREECGADYYIEDLRDLLGIIQSK